MQNKIQAKEKKKLHDLQDSSKEVNGYWVSLGFVTRFPGWWLQPTLRREEEGGEGLEIELELGVTQQMLFWSEKNRPNNQRRARAEYRRKIEEKEQGQEETVKRKQEAEIAKKKYKEQRLHRFKKLNQKTRKGQPVMQGKIELMLEALQQVDNS
ncbi:Thyroid transcription factor 1-associated protein 26 [Chionoecetes opilio]|uniref:Thyroid transcription factor 1-associated protein 26 n=1 Tax=Chionoecetes opilio TaxID=41210 RepID=A0A8J4XZF5_CHIOP|nr:Thyroid transcription factor 1-associated protein 26 [Chionoecetes opilio]